MSYALQITLAVDTYGMCSNLTITHDDTEITVSDGCLWPTAQQVASGDWTTSAGGNSCTSLSYRQSTGELTFENQVSGSGGDSTVRQVYRGSVVDYLLQVMAQLRLWNDGSEHHELHPEEAVTYPTFPPAPEGITLTVDKEQW